mmetsp:Transcript_32431/g.84194  ORF Transcript_32431/g.84194 Transcript_32431/m.84194 type:complete len:270 (+) Transcript_32431:649-1458(+)
MVSVNSPRRSVIITALRSIFSSASVRCVCIRAISRRASASLLVAIVSDEMKCTANCHEINIADKAHLPCVRRKAAIARMNRRYDACRSTKVLEATWRIRPSRESDTQCCHFAQHHAAKPCTDAATVALPHRARRRRAIRRLPSRATASFHSPSSTRWWVCWHHLNFLSTTSCTMEKLLYAAFHNRVEARQAARRNLLISLPFTACILRTARTAGSRISFRSHSSWEDNCPHTRHDLHASTTWVSKRDLFAILLRRTRTPTAVASQSRGG